MVNKAKEGTEMIANTAKAGGDLMLNTAKAGGNLVTRSRTYSSVVHPEIVQLTAEQRKKNKAERMKDPFREKHGVRKIFLFSSPEFYFEAVMFFTLLVSTYWVHTYICILCTCIKYITYITYTT